MKLFNPKKFPANCLLARYSRWGFIVAILAFCRSTTVAGSVMDIAADSFQNIALNRAAYQSSSADDDHTAHLATDGHDETYWESHPSDSAWIAVDLGKACSFNAVKLHWGECFATSFRLQTSNEALHPQNWTDLFEMTNGTGGVQKISAPAVARHVRLLVTAFSDRKRGCVLKEFEVEGRRKERLASSPQPGLEANGNLILTGGNWKLQNAMFVQAAPAQMAQPGFDDSSWLPAVVPGTVLGSYLAIGAIPDPYFGDQMSQISEEFFSRHDFWYRDSFVAPVNYAGKKIWLNFDGINWKADVFLNGKNLGDINGAFIRGKFDVTSAIKPGETNILAVLIHRVAHPEPGEKKVTHKKVGAATSNGDLLGYDSPTFLATAGWNWLPIVRGRDVGIWNEVRLEASGDVAVLDPWVTAELPDNSHANLTVQTELRNTSNKSQTGKLVGTIGGIQFEQPLTLAPGETRLVAFDKTNFPALALRNPKLWWPNGYGDQPLYKLDLRFEQPGGVSDEKSVNFGIRKLECRVLNKVLTLFVNGTRILCRGGNWGMAEGMLNCDAAGFDVRVRLHRDANLNMIRNWVGMEGHEAFYDACDRYGILVWDDFWLANPLDGPDPTDHEMFLANAHDKILRVRSHPSLALYCGRNEGNPPADLDAGMLAAVNSLDGTRRYIPNSADGTVTGLGPYKVMGVDWYFANRGKTFHSEQGIIAVPPVESMKAMLPAEKLWPINDMWAQHDYQTVEHGVEGRSPLYTQLIEKRYGKISCLEDYCRKAQLLNLESAKAMFECLQANQGGGLLLWMTQSAWPSLICQLYDHYFEMTGAFFGAKKGCEPLHILWDANADIIKVANNTPFARNGLTAEAHIYDLAGKEVWRNSTKLDLPLTCVKNCFPLTRPTNSSTVFFVKLVLWQGKTILSDNFYWSGAKAGSCAALNGLPPVKLATEASQTQSNGTCRISARISNPSQSVALAIRLKVQHGDSAERVLPVFYDENYFSLLPGENRTVSLEFPDASLNGESPKLVAEGWNIPAQAISLDEHLSHTSKAKSTASRF